eukprot:1109337-Amphidinium_carterae.1
MACSLVHSIVTCIVVAVQDFTREPNAQCGFLLDAAYTFAVAINNLLNADVPKASHDQIRGSVLLEEMKMVEFEGITGTVGYPWS